MSRRSFYARVLLSLFGIGLASICCQPSALLASPHGACPALVTPAEPAAHSTGKSQAAHARQDQQAGDRGAPKPQQGEAPAVSRRPPRGDAQKRADYVRALAERFGIGPGKTVADIGAGNGRDSWVFAEIVGPEGTVFAEEIAQGKVEAIAKEARERQLAQVKPVLGRVDDPCLAEESVDLAFMHYVYHHVTRPREMLRGIWRALKPGGYFVVVDRHRGTLRDWVPREERGSKHFWIAETTVVREAREEGFLFVDCAEELWPGDDQFVLVFQRPKGQGAPGHDPDPFAPLNLAKLEGQLLPAEGKYQRPVFIALGEGRKLIGPILEHSEGEGVEVVLEEWATQRDERPPLSQGVQLPSVLTEQGDPNLDEKPIDVVFFLDTYHLLFHHETLLAGLAERLTPGGKIYVLDRRADEVFSRRLCSHRRKIAPQLVKEEMAKAGFRLLAELDPPAADRFLLVFGKAEGGEPAR